MVKNLDPPFHSTVYKKSSLRGSTLFSTASERESPAPTTPTLEQHARCVHLLERILLDPASDRLAGSTTELGRRRAAAFATAKDVTGFAMQPAVACAPCPSWGRGSRGEAAIPQSRGLFGPSPDAATPASLRDLSADALKKRTTRSKGKPHRNHNRYPLREPVLLIHHR